MPTGVYERTEKNTGWTAWNKGTKGIVKTNSGSFKKGHKRGMTGKTHSEETKSKMKDSATEGDYGFKKDRTPWNKDKPFPQVAGKNNPNWKGDYVGYNALHTWVARNFGSPKKCSKCGTTKKQRYEWANISGKYLRARKDWIRLCTSCHRRLDGNMHKAWVTRRAKKNTEPV